MKITNNEIVVELPEVSSEIHPIHQQHIIDAFRKVEKLNPPRVVDVEALAKILYKRIDGHDSWEFDAEDDEKSAYRSYAQHLAENLDKWLIEKKEVSNG